MRPSGKLDRALGILFVACPAIYHPPAVLQLRSDDRLGQVEGVGVIHYGAILGRSQVHVAARGATHDEPHRAAHAQGRDANAAPYARFERLGSDLPTAQYDDGIYRLERNALVAFGRRNEQRPTTMLHVGAMVTHVYGIQVTHSNTTFFTYLLTLCGALVTLGRQ